MKRHGGTLNACDQRKTAEGLQTKRFQPCDTPGEARRLRARSSVVGRDGRVTGWSTGGVQGNETPLCDTVTGTHVTMHLFKPMECTTPRVNSNVNYGLQATTMCNVGSSIRTNAPPWRWLSTAGRSSPVGGQGMYRSPLFFLLNFAVNLNVPKK